jgi:hypothetical protein
MMPKQRKGYGIFQLSPRVPQSLKESRLEGSFQFLQHGAAALADCGIGLILANAG